MTNECSAEDFRESIHAHVKNLMDADYQARDLDELDDDTPWNNRKHLYAVDALFLVNGYVPPAPDSDEFYGRLKKLFNTDARASEFMQRLEEHGPAKLDDGRKTVSPVYSTQDVVRIALGLGYPILEGHILFVWTTRISATDEPSMPLPDVQELRYRYSDDGKIHVSIVFVTGDTREIGLNPTKQDGKLFMSLTAGAVEHKAILTEILTGEYDNPAKRVNALVSDLRKKIGAVLENVQSQTTGQFLARFTVPVIDIEKAQEDTETRKHTKAYDDGRLRDRR